MKKGYLYIAVAVVMFTSFEVVLKFIAGQINPIQLTLNRFSIGAVVLLPLAAYNLRKRGQRVDRASVAYFALLGLIGIALCMPILQMAVSYAGSSVSALMFSCNPVFVAFLAYFILKEPIKPRHIAALTLEIVGTVVIISPWNTKVNLTGAALALLSTLLFSLYGVMGKKKVAEYGGAVVTFFSFVFGSLILLAFACLTHLPAAAQLFQSVGLGSFANIPLFWEGCTREIVPYVLYVSVGVAGIGFLAYFLAMEYQPASVVSLVYFFKPALSPILAWAVHGEEISLNMLLGIVLIVAGSLCAIIPGILEGKNAISS